MISRDIKNYWMKRETLTILEAISLIMGRNPDNSWQSISLSEEERNRQHSQFFSLIWDAIHAGKIKVINPDIEGNLSQRIPIESIIKWVIEKDFDNLPDYIRNYGKEIAEERQKVGKEKKRTTALGGLLKRLYSDLSNNYKKHISATEIWNHILSNKDKFKDVITAITSQELTWKTGSGKLKIIKREDFDKRLTPIRNEILR